MINSGTWIYSKKPGIMRITYGGENIPVNYKNVGLKTGWNFKSISRSMIGKQLSEIKGNCNITKVANWDNSNQKWNYPSNLLFNENNIYQVFATLLQILCKYYNFLQYQCGQEFEDLFKTLLP